LRRGDRGGRRPTPISATESRSAAPDAALRAYGGASARHRCRPRALSTGCGWPWGKLLKLPARATSARHLRAIRRARNCGQEVRCLPRDRDVRSVVFVGRYDDEPRTSKGDRGLARGSDLRRRSRLWSASRTRLRPRARRAQERWRASVHRRRQASPSGGDVGRRSAHRANSSSVTPQAGEGSRALR
jgi:hypothetical protein